MLEYEFTAHQLLCAPRLWIFLAHSNGAFLRGSSFSFENKINHILLNSCVVSECQIANAL